MNKLLAIIPEKEDVLREAIKNSEIPEDTLLAAIGHPSKKRHWKALQEITGKSIDQLKAELDPPDPESKRH